MFIKLNHFCHLPGAEGQPGDVVQMTEEQAARILQLKGGVVVDAPKRGPGRPRKSKPAEVVEPLAEPDE